VIDPLANLDLSELYALFESPGIQKIVHASGEDLRLLHSLGCYPKNVFDTEVAARLLNYEHTSLTVLLRDKLAFEMDKKEQKSNWLRRPLSGSQVQYAADDVLWLHPLKRVLEAEAGAKDLLPFLREEQELLSTTIYPSLAKTNFLKPSDLYTLSPREQYITNELLGFFHELAREFDRPVYQVMREEVVRSLAAGTRLPESIVQDQGVHPRLKNSRFVARLAGQLAQIRKASQNLSDEKQRRPKLTPAEWAAVNKAADNREKVFAPIQQALVQRFGEHATKFLFSNKTMNSLLEGAITLQDIKPAYRQYLIRNIAAEAGIDLGAYDIDAAGRK
jgi:ribonuclease D